MFSTTFRSGNQWDKLSNGCKRLSCSKVNYDVLECRISKGMKLAELNARKGHAKNESFAEHFAGLVRVQHSDK